MRCRDFVDLVTAFLDRALDSYAEHRFVEHLACCPGCRRYFDQMRATIRILRGVRSASQPAGG